MIDTPSITHTEDQPTAVIALTIPRDQIRTVMEPAIRELMSTLAAQGIAPSGPLFSYHLRMDPAIFDFEIGVPVAGPVAVAGRVRPSRLRAAKVARTIYHGPYEELGDAWGAFKQWIKANGHTSAENLWECYVAGPEASADSANWRTELNCPLIG